MLSPATAENKFANKTGKPRGWNVTRESIALVRGCAEQVGGARWGGATCAAAVAAPRGTAGCCGGGCWAVPPYPGCGAPWTCCDAGACGP